MRAKVEIVFRRKVRAVWLDQGMALAAQDLPWHEARPALAEAVTAGNPGTETIRKVLEHVRRIWFEPPDDCKALRSAALILFRSGNSPATRTLLNWGMAMAVYPFLGSVAEALGRLLRLQHEARRADIQRRLREQHGDRDFVSRITRYDISSFLDWGVIAETRKAGVYLAGEQVRPRTAEHLGWLAEVLLVSKGQSQMPLAQFSHHPILFPVKLGAFNSSALSANPRLAVERHSLNEEVVSFSQQAERNANGAGTE